MKKVLFHELKNNHYNPVYENLKTTLNRYLILGVIPEEIITSRLFCLNKKSDEVGEINNIIPIAISSTFIKLIESAILTIDTEDIPFSAFNKNI